MKILFLDIDGVCNNHSTTERFKGYLGIDPNLAKLVQDIIKATGCKVVLSSTWRLTPEFAEHVRKVVCDFIDVTPNMQKGAGWGVKPRGEEVKAWLEQHPEVEKYAILDDNSDFLPGQHLFQTSFIDGITDKTVSAVIKHLGRAKK